MGFGETAAVAIIGSVVGAGTTLLVAYCTNWFKIASEQRRALWERRLEICNELSVLLEETCLRIRFARVTQLSDQLTPDVRKKIVEYLSDRFGEIRQQVWKSQIILSAELTSSIIDVASKLNLAIQMLELDHEGQGELSSEHLEEVLVGVRDFIDHARGQLGIPRLDKSGWEKAFEANAKFAEMLKLIPFK